MAKLSLIFLEPPVGFEPTTCWLRTASAYRSLSFQYNRPILLALVLLAQPFKNQQVYLDCEKAVQW